MNSTKNNSSDDFILIAGPCVIENEITTMKVAEEVSKIGSKFGLKVLFKSSFKKANRSKIDSFTGLGDIKALKILKDVGEKVGLPTITDIHGAEEAKITSEYVDYLQIPAFLARQTELLIAAGKTGLPVNIKKGQFMSPESMKFAVEKVKSTGNENIYLTERGSFFGYGDLVVDFRSIPKMKKIAPTILDVTHSLQQPNQESGVSGGNPEFIETLALAGVASGVNGLFIETHPDPSKALSDGSNMLKLDSLEVLIEKILILRNAILTISSK